MSGAGSGACELTNHSRLGGLKETGAKTGHFRMGGGDRSVALDSMRNLMCFSALNHLNLHKQVIHNKCMNLKMSITCLL